MRKKEEFDLPLCCPTWGKLLIGVCHWTLRNEDDGKREMIRDGMIPYTSSSHEARNPHLGLVIIGLGPIRTSRYSSHTNDQILSLVIAHP
jgi:hypothetical protein